MSPRTWPTWVWVALTLAATAFGYQLTLGRYSLATGVALFAGACLGPRQGARTQAIAALPALALTGFGVVGSLLEWGYIAGRIGAAYLAGGLAPADQPLRSPRSVFRMAVLMLAAAVPAAAGWQEPWEGLNLRTYYNAVLVMAMIIAFFYALRLVRYPARVLGFTVALLPYYLLGLSWAALVVTLGWVETAGTETWSNVAFHGYVAHLPADVLTAVVVAFFSGPRTQARHS